NSDVSSCDLSLTIINNNFINNHLRYRYFFFQAEDGIRDRNVTGVQTCALPIYEYDLNNIEIVNMEDGRPVMYPLSDFVTVEETEDTSVIQHKNGERTAELQVYAADEAELETLISKYSEDLESSTEVIVGGESSDQTDFFVEIGILFSVILI